jgi:hypothetical protein
VNAKEAKLKAAFDAFAAAVQSADVAAYRKLAVNDAPLQEKLFEKNATRVKAGNWTLRLKALGIEGEVGEATFDVLDAKGKALDEGHATFTLEAGTWKLRTL